MTCISAPLNLFRYSFDVAQCQFMFVSANRKDSMSPLVMLNKSVDSNRMIKQNLETPPPRNEKQNLRNQEQIIEKPVSSD